MPSWHKFEDTQDHWGMNFIGRRRRPWSYGSWTYNYLCNQCLSPLKLLVRNPLMVRCTRYNTKWKSLSVTCNRSVIFSEHTSFFHHSTDRHDVTEILLKVALNTINLTLTRSIYWLCIWFSSCRCWSVSVQRILGILFQSLSSLSHHWLTTWEIYISRRISHAYIPWCYL